MSDTVTLTLEELEEIKAQLVEMDAVLTRLLAQPLVYATVVKADNKFHLDAFEQGDRMLVIDKASASRRSSTARSPARASMTRDG